MTKEASYVDDDGVMVLPDGSGAFVQSFPLPPDHWLYAAKPSEPPAAPLVIGCLRARPELEKLVRDAARHAIRAATRQGKEMDFDPDAMVQAFIMALLGPDPDRRVTAAR